MKPKIEPKFLPDLVGMEKALLGVVAAVSATYLISYLYIYNPGAPLQQTAYRMLWKIAETYGTWQVYNAFYYMFGASEKILLLTAYALGAIFFLILHFTQRTNPTGVLRSILSLLMLKTAGTAAFKTLVLVYGAAATLEYTGVERKGPAIMLKNKMPTIAAKWVPIAVLSAILLPGLAIPYGLDVSLSSAAWTHYKNAISIYETGLPALGTGFFDSRFTLYPPLSHYLLALAKITTGMPMAAIMQAAYAVFSAIAIVFAYMLAREISGEWYAAIVVVYAGLNPHLLGSAFFGNYAELVSSAIAGACLFCVARYERHDNRPYFVAAAVLFALTVSAHWLFAMVLSAFFVIYFATIRRNKGDILLFSSTAALFLLPYLIFLAGKAGNAQGIAWIFTKYPTNQPCGIKCMLLPTFLPFKQIFVQSDWMLLVFGAIGLVLGVKNRLMRIPAAMFFITAIGFYLLQDYLTFFYPNRLLWLIKFYFAYFIGYGIYTTAKELLNRKRMGALFILIFLGALLAANIYDQTTHLKAMSERKQALASADRDAVIWIKENTNGQDVVAADALRLENVYGFTKTRILQPPQAAEVLGNPEKGEGALVYISSPKGACGFPCTDAIQLRKNESLVRIWKSLSFEKTKGSLVKTSTIFFEEDNTYIFRVK